MLATHPTMLGMALPVISWAVVGFLFEGRLFRPVFPKSLSRRHYLAFLKAAGLAITVLSFLYSEFYGKSYFAGFADIITRTNDPSTSNYFKPWHVYFLWIGKDFFFAHITLAIFVAYSALLYSCTKCSIKPIYLFSNFYLITFFICLFFVISLTTRKWKFDRILVEFISSYAVFLGLTIGFIVTWLKDQRYFNVSFIMTISCLIFFIFTGSWNVHKYTSKASNNLVSAREKYFGLYAQLTYINSPLIGTLLNEKERRGAQRYLSISGKGAVELCRDRSSLLTRQGKDEFWEQLLTSGVSHVLMGTGRNTPGDDTDELYPEVVSVMASLCGNRIYSWRGLYEIWFFQPLLKSPDIAAALFKLPSNSKLGVWGGEAEIGTRFWRRYKHVAQHINARVYPLRINGWTSEKNLYFLEQNKVGAVLLPDLAYDLTIKDKIQEMEALLRTKGWNEIGSSSPLEVKLWIKSHTNND